jgi:PAS domain-containing protein
LTESWKDLLVITRAGPFPAPPQVPQQLSNEGKSFSFSGDPFCHQSTSTVSLALEESNRARLELLLRESEARPRESEERFSTAFRLVPLNITILRLGDGKFVEANDAFVRWLGLDRRKIIGHDSQELEIW